MSTFTKEFLSESTDGKQIKITTTATPGDLIHTATSGVVNYDEIYIQAVNADASGTHKITVEWGEATSPDGHIEYTVPSEDGYKLIIAGNILQNSLEVRIFADLADVIMINGYVHRETVA